MKTQEQLLSCLEFNLGSKLHNGATIIDWQLFTPASGIVLAWWARSGGEFIVWTIGLINKQWQCWQGHYFRSLDDAIKYYDDERGAND